MDTKAIQEALATMETYMPRLGKLDQGRFRAQMAIIRAAAPTPATKGKEKGK